MWRDIYSIFVYVVCLQWKAIAYRKYSNSLNGSNKFAPTDEKK